MVVVVWSRVTAISESDLSMFGITRENGLIDGNNQRCELVVSEIENDNRDGHWIET